MLNQPALDTAATVRRQSWLFQKGLYLLDTAVGYGIHQHRWSKKERLWLWSSAWYMGFVSLYGLSYGVVLGALIDASLLGAMVGALLSSMAAGLAVNGIYQILIALFSSDKAISEICLHSLVRGLTITMGMTLGVLLGGSVGFAIALTIHLIIMLISEHSLR